jgi:hypothetical protein
LQTLQVFAVVNNACYLNAFGVAGVDIGNTG